MVNGKRLGRGLETLLGRIGTSTPPEMETHHIDEEQSVLPSNKIDITKIIPNPFQPRKVFDETELEQFAQVIHTQGLLHPIAVRQVGGLYQIVAGERRFRAALRLGWSEIPAQIYEADDQTMVEVALTENIQRKDLNAIEKATAFANYLQTYSDTTHEELANRLQIDRSTVTNMLRLLTLPTQLQDAVCQETLTQGHVRALLSLKNDAERIETAKKIQAEGWSVRETEKYVQTVRQTDTAHDWNVVDQEGKTKTVRKPSEQILQLENDFRHFLGGAKVKLVQSNEKGKGQLVVSFSNHAEFERVYAAICKSNRTAG